MKKVILLIVSVLVCLFLALYPSTDKVSAYFEYAKKNEALMTAFLHKMPKGADLHFHLTGAGYADYMLDYAIRNNMVFDRTTQSMAVSTVNPHYTAQDMSYNSVATSEVLRAFTLRDNSDMGANSGHDHFFNAFAKFGNIVDASAMFYEVIIRAGMQNISYIEIMTNPPFADIDNITNWLVGIDNIRKQIKIATGNDVRVGITLTLNRNGVPNKTTPLNQAEYEKYFSDNVDKFMDVAIALQGKGIAGITLLSAEDNWVSRTQFDTQMTILDKSWNKHKEQGIELNMNLHAGELTSEYSPYESLTNHISNSIYKGHAKRIGHGVAIAWEHDVYDLLKYMRNNRIAVEVCPSSNEKILRVSADKHPFALYRDAGVPIVISTDDEGISRSNLTLEYLKAVKWFDLSYEYVRQLAFNSLEYSFIPGESLFENGDYERIKKNVPVNSEKATMQLQLIKQFEEFETSMVEVIKDGFPARK